MSVGDSGEASFVDGPFEWCFSGLEAFIVSPPSLLEIMSFCVLS